MADLKLLYQLSYQQLLYFIPPIVTFTLYLICAFIHGTFGFFLFSMGNTSAYCIYKLAQILFELDMHTNAPDVYSDWVSAQFERDLEVKAPLLNGKWQDIQQNKSGTLDTPESSVADV